MKRLSPGLVTEDEVYIKGRRNISMDIGGVTQLDYLDLYKRFTYKAQEFIDWTTSLRLNLGRRN